MTARRLEEVRNKLAELRLQAFIVTFPPHVQYLTGFSGSNGLSVLLRDRHFFFSDGRYRDQAQEEVKGARIVISHGSLFEAIRKKNLLPKGGKVGYASEYVTVAALEKLRKLFSKITFIATSGVVEQIASVKDEGEIQTIKEAVGISDRVFQKALEILRPGVREREVAAEISYLHRKFGAEADAFEPIVASGTRGALPHARASSKSIQNGEMVTLDFGCRFQGYHSDLTRSISMGKPSEEMRAMYSVVREAQEKAIESARSGMKAKSLDAKARTYISSRGYGKWFSHSLGHGLGLAVHELPRVSRLSNDILRERNVLTIEPGIYVPGLGGVRIEDDVVIRNGRCEVLNQSPKELMIL